MKRSAQLAVERSACSTQADASAAVAARLRSCAHGRPRARLHLRRPGNELFTLAQFFLTICTDCESHRPHHDLPAPALFEAGAARAALDARARD
jgi:hypothetical protein